MPPSLLRFHVPGISLYFVLALPAVALVGCSSGPTSPGNPPPQPAGSTNVIVLLRSTANDKLQDFLIILNNVSLSDESGNIVTLFTGNPNAGTGGLNLPAEFMHVNGVSEPLVTVSIPQGTYTSAKVTVGYCSFTKIYINANSVTTSTWAQGLCGQGTGTTTVNLAPLVINGSAMALVLDLQVSQSYTLNGTGTSATYAISPVFNLYEVPISSEPTSDQNGKITGIDAQITSVNEAKNSFVAQTVDGASLSVYLNGKTAYQGIPGVSSLAAGLLVNLDMIIQTDASLVATRVEADDTMAVIGTIGPLAFVGSPNPNAFTTAWLEGVGCANPNHPFCGTIYQYDGNTLFGVSAQFTNLQNLPFTPAFDSLSMVLGQNYLVHSSGQPNQQSIETASSVILSPQTINGTISAVSNAGGFSVYTVQLAPYDLIPTLQGQGGSIFPPVTDPTTLTVYADTNTRMLNAAPISVANPYRFRGVILDDNGTLRMDCEQINDGVSTSDGF